jgi:sporulation protein YlmC with PRC-barrel domain
VPNGTCGKLKLYPKTADSSPSRPEKTAIPGLHPAQNGNFGKLVRLCFNVQTLGFRESKMTIHYLEEVIMSYEERDTYGMYVDNGHKGPGPELMGADTLIGDHVHNLQNEHLGEIKEIMLDMRTGKIAYAVMAGGVLTIGEKLFAVPWEALTLDTVNKRFTLNLDKERIENAPGFDTDHWPNMANQTWASQIHTYYGTTANTSL